MPDPKKFVYFRRYDKVNWEKFNGDVSNLTSQFLASPFDPNKAFTELITGITAIINKHVPLKRKAAKLKDQPWMKPAIKRLLDLRDQKYAKWKETNLGSYREQFRELKKRAKRAITSAEAQLFASVKDNAAKLWSVLKDLLNRKPKSVAVTVALDELNHHFVNMGCHGTASQLDAEPTAQPPAFQFLPVTSMDIEVLLNKLARTKKAAGPGGIPNRLMHQVRDFIKEPLAVLINRCMDLGVYPDVFKIAHVTPLAKVPAPKTADDYRPISLINNVSKVFERVVQSQLVKFLKDNNILSDRQSGFRNGHSTETLLLKVTEKWRRAIDNGEVVVAAFLDLKKAFDSVNHSLLLRKLERIGVSGTAGKWFANYLSGREQSVAVGEKHSGFLPITAGVPQGTVLGPVLFTIFIDDLLRMDCVGRKAELECFADDTLAYSIHKNPDVAVKNLNEALGDAKDWFIVNHLRLNERKCQSLYLSMRHQTKKAMCDAARSVRIGDVVVERAETVKYLGVLIDRHLTFEDHCAKVKRAASAGIHAINRVKRSLPNPKRAMLYNAFVQPHFDYCASVWSPMSTTLQNQITSVQRRAVKAMIGGQKMEVEDFMEKFTITPVIKRWRSQEASWLYKLLHRDKHNLPAYMSEIVEIAETRSQRKGQFCVKSVCRTDFGESLLSRRLRKVLQEFSSAHEIWDAPNVFCFKSKLVQCLS